jgi:carbohydrate esterase-like protein/GDSL-like lipase/acylhydrolase family protein
MQLRRTRQVSARLPDFALSALIPALMPALWALLAGGAGCGTKGAASGDAGSLTQGTGGSSQGTASGMGGVAGSNSTGGSSSAGGSAASGGAGAGASGGSAAGIGAGGGAADTGGSTGAGGAIGAGGSTAAGGATGAGGSSNAGGNPGGTGAPAARIVGRTAPGTMGGTRFEWSGSNVSARFMGTQVSVQLDDGSNGNSFEVVVDGGTPKQMFTVAGQTTYSLATGLTNGMHDVLLWRDSEAMFGPTEFIAFTGFGAGGALLPPAPPPGRSIEIVGDSFSCGAGILSATNCGSSIKIENHYLSYGAIAAREVTADLVTIAWSGIGVWRNYGATAPTPTTVMPARYDYAIPTTQTAWDFSKYQPDVVVMNLNNNDFSKGDPGQPYIDAYLKLTRQIRTNYPNATFIHVIEWETGNTTDQSAATTVNAMVATLKAGGDPKHNVFDMRPYANTKQCGGHPDMAASQAMGDALAANLRTVMGW